MKRIKIIWTFAKKYLGLFSVAELCILAMYTVSLLLPLNLSVLTDDILYGKHYELLNGVIINYIILLAIAIISNSIYAFVWQTLSNKYVLEIKKTMYKKTIYSKAEWLSNINTGDIMSRIDWESDQFLYFIQRNIFHFINSILLCFGIIAILWIIDIKISIFLTITTLMPIIITRLFGKKLEKYSNLLKNQIGELNGWLLDIISNIKVVRLNSAIVWAKNKINKYLLKIINLENKSRWLDFHSNKTIYIINLLSSIWVYWYCMNLIENKLLTVGLFLAIIELTALLHRKFNWILIIYMDWFSRKINIDRVIEVLEIETEENSGINLNEKIDCISFKNVSFKYDKNNVLTDLSFCVNKGEKIAIVGKSGIGKTTLINLLLGFMKCNEGKILINGKNICDLNVFDLRQKISTLNQEIVLMDHLSIRDNLLLGGAVKKDSDLFIACKKVGLLDKVSSLPNGLHTILKDSKLDLSGGEKQRLMLARLFLKDADVLVLDEATSALDETTEKTIVDAILKEFADKTMFVVSHRINTIKSCNKVIVLDGGKISYFGEYANVKNNSVFRKLFEVKDA